MLPYAKERDLAIFELRRSLPHHHGLSFSLDELQVGQEVDIYGYPKGTINPTRKLTRFPATFKASTTSGLLAFDYQLSPDNSIRIRGASGGIVVDRKTEKIVGILSETTEATALAVPVQTLADFVSKVQPFLAQRIFPDTKEVHQSRQTFIQNSYHPLTSIQNSYHTILMSYSTDLRNPMKSAC